MKRQLSDLENELKESITKIVINQLDKNLKNVAIPLKNRKGEIVAFTRVSPEHYEALNQFNWTLTGKGYAAGTISKKHVKMHLYIWKFLLNNTIPLNHLVDHINGPNKGAKRLDNRIENLRVITVPQNAQSKIKRINASSKYHGVNWIKNQKKWQAGVTINHKFFNLGFYKEEIEAAEAYDCFLWHHPNRENLYYSINFKEKDYSNQEPFKPRKYSSNFYGVSKNKKTGKFYVNLAINGKAVFCKSFENEIEAAKKSDSIMVKNNYKKKLLNFPEDYSDYNYIKPIKIFKEDVPNQNYVKLICKNKKLSGNVIIDSEDYERIKYYSLTNDDENYCILRIDKKNVRLHRFIMGVTDPNLVVDHFVESNRFDNRKSSLCVVEQHKNSDCQKTKNNGVNKVKYGYQAQIRNSGRLIFSYTHKEEVYCRRARDLFILYSGMHKILEYDDWNVFKLKEEWIAMLNLKKNKHFVNFLK